MTLTNVATYPVHGLALCAGVGTIELGLRLAIGSTYRTVGYVERNAFAAAVLVARMAEACMDRAPVWDDLATFDGRAWRGKVDIITAGFPCQPFSQAGQRRGTNDERWLWPHVHRVINDVQPSFVFIENVPPIIKHGLGSILDDLAGSGFDAEWDCISAADVGAPHTRKRFWLLAYSDSERLASIRFAAQQEQHLADRQSGTDVANPESVTRRPGLRETETGQEAARLDVTEPRDVGSRLANADRTRPQRAVHRLPLWPPRPDDHSAWNKGGAMPQPSVCRTSDGLAHRVDRLHAIGNGVVPLVAAYALVRLAERARGDTGAPVTAATQSSCVAQPDRSAATTGCADRHG